MAKRKKKVSILEDVVNDCLEGKAKQCLLKIAFLFIAINLVFSVVVPKMTQTVSNSVNNVVENSKNIGVKQ